MRSAARRVLGLVLLAAVGFAPAVRAQVATGNIYGTVKDESGAVLPGATATLTGAFGTRTTTSGTDGEFRFLNIDHGTQTLKVTLTGFTGISRSVVISSGQNVELGFSLKVATVEETVTVTGDVPVVDTKKVGTATTISKEELAEIPTSRDPWALMRTVPGVLVDRVNIAGSESGQQSNFYGKGADIKDSVWSLDGIVITDMAAIGASPSYFTFDTFDEVNFSTGGNDVRMATGGIGVGLVTKRGTNQFHGSANENFTHDKLQSSNLPAELVGDPRLQGSDKADHTQQINDYSFDLGGPIVKDKLWFYGSYGRNDIRVKRLTQSFDKTLLKNYSAKVNWQATSADMISGFWFLGDKAKTGRAGAVAGTTQLEGTLWNQADAFSSGPHGLSKLEWNHIFGPKLFLNVKGGYYNTGFGLVPQGGLDGVFIVDNIAAVTRGTSFQRLFLRPQYTASGEATYFASGLGGNNELRFGGGWRRVNSTSRDNYPDGGVQERFNAASTRARFYRDTDSESRDEFVDAYVADTYTKDRLTLNVGLRFDHQKALDTPSSVPGSAMLGSLLPALDYAGGATNVTWNDFSPRVGFTYALDQANKTVLRGS
ncbi:MAG TPA: carboxypeptidase regulatory-like domain-containing protein, partial [Vicinamibacteria bacterium]|nr:carboxypeptidase regulatory-like domain-containing protein [Vicinamibacteria bacterium]